jgi:hypothetical protein
MEEIDGLKKGGIEAVGDLLQGERLGPKDLPGIFQAIEFLPFDRLLMNLKDHGRILA